MGAELSHPVALLIQCINFAILLFIIVKFGKKPFTEYLKNRHDTVKERIEEAERLLKDAQEAKALYVGKLSKLPEEIEAFRALALKEAETERTKILAEAEELAARIREHHFATQPEIKPSIPIEVLANYMAAVKLHMIIWWLENGMPYPAQQMADMCSRLTIGGTAGVLAGLQAK